MRRRWKRVGVAFVVMGGAVALWLSGRDKSGAIVRARTLSWYELAVPGGDTLYFSALSADTLFENFSSSRDKARCEFICNAFFISYSGRLATVADSMVHPDTFCRNVLSAALRKESDKQKMRARYCREMLNEMAYYEQTHSVADEEFHQVMAYEEQLKVRMAEAEKLYAAVMDMQERPDAAIRLCMQREVYCHTDEEGVVRVVSYPCRKLAENEDGSAVWQMETGQLPLLSTRLRPNPLPYMMFHSYTHLYKIWGYFGKHRHVSLADTVRPEVICVRMNGMQPSVPMIPGTDGAPVTGTWGSLNGMMVRGRCVSAFEIYGLQLKGTVWFRCIWEDMKAWICRMYVKTQRMCR